MSDQKLLRLRIFVGFGGAFIAGFLLHGAFDSMDRGRTMFVLLDLSVVALMAAMLTFLGIVISRPPT